MKSRSEAVFSRTEACVISCLVGLVIMVGCAANYVVINPLVKPLSVYPSLVIGQIEDALPQELPSEDHPSPETIERLRLYLAEAIRETKLFSHVSIGLPDDAAPKPRLLLDGRILSYRGGGRAMRYITFSQAGAGKFVVEISLRDRDRRETIFVGNFKGEVSGGWFGGSSDKPLKQISGDFAKFLKKSWE